jgi:hypothetical protein
MGEVENKGVRSTGKKILKIKGTTAIRVRRGSQWDRSQIRLPVGPLYFFIFTPTSLYFYMNNTTLAKCPNY